MSRFTLAAVISVVLVGTAAPCSAELFSVDVPDLEGAYGGFGGQSHEDEFDFGQDFAVINRAWVHVVGIADISTGGPSALIILGALDGVSSPFLELPKSTEFAVDVPLSPTETVMDGTGVVRLEVIVFACCDHQALVTAATLWFDAEPLEPIPAVSAWGMFVLALLLLTGVTLIVMRRFAACHRYK